MRERGLKFYRKAYQNKGLDSRSREGAWIEIKITPPTLEMVHVAPVRERGLKYKQLQITFIQRLVAPVRERGLK